MSGLGAQARAAEYAAATAARARQVSREAEDQKLPPKSAPISLSALAKAQSTSRNKGPKAWKPLNMDDITESSDDGSPGKESGRGTPVASTRTMLERTSLFPYRQVPASSTRAEDIKVSIPTAPRAMLTSNIPANTTASSSPQRMRPDATVELRSRQGNQDIFDSPVPLSYGALPYPAFPLHSYSQHLNFLVMPPSREPAQFQRFGSLMVPSDLSPTKQQQKFEMLGQMQHATYAMAADEPPADMGPHQMVPQYDPAYYEQINTGNMSAIGDVYGWDVSTNDNIYDEYALHHQRYQEHVDVIFGDERGKREDDFYASTGASALHLVSTAYGMGSVGHATNEHAVPASYHDHAGADSGYQCRRSSLISVSEGKGQAHSATYEYDEPYDRKRRMQSFVAEATQEALARKGKTVLHNPDLYKAKDQPQQLEKRSDNNTDLSSATYLESNCASTDKQDEQNQHRRVPWDAGSRPSDGTQEVMPTPAGQVVRLKINLQPSLSKGELEIIANATNNPTPRLEFPQFESRATVVNDPINGEPSDERLHPIDQVGSEEWAKFRPITSIERERVRACMAKAAADLAPKIPRPGLFDRENNTGGKTNQLKDSQEWFRTDLRGEQAFRAQLPGIAEKHAKFRRAAARHANGGCLPKGYNLGVDDGVAASIIMGEVIANLSSYTVGDRKSAEQRKNFHKVKSVPEFATERGGVSGGPGSSDSYFDDDEAGFQGAPIRIARDPRFRPQGKEGLKLKPEEEWQNRHDCYGRRVL